jgi:hypothetical protein
MPTRRLLHRPLVALVAALVVGCSTLPDLAQPDPATTPGPSPQATEDPTSEPAPPRAGSGTLDIDDVVIEVQGDCDLSRAFGREDPFDPDVSVDLVLEVRDAPDQPFSVRVRLVGGGSVLGRTLVVVGGADADPTDPPTWDGTVTEATLQAHPTGDSDTVVLEIVAVSGPDDQASRQARLTVDCAVTQPG